MKNLLQNLLICVALALCGLIAFQWVRETRSAREIQKLNDALHDKAETIQALQGTVKRNEAEIQRLDTLKNQLTEIVKSNNVEIAELTKSVEKAEAENHRNLKQIQVYSEALQTANDNIKKQNEEISKQNEAVKKLADERNEAVKKLNKITVDFNDLAAKWNKQQEELAKPPAKK